MSDKMACNYYAFISYSRKDLQAAKFLQRGLERFKYSVFPVPEEYRPSDPAYLRKIFRDNTDLGFKEKTFHDGLRRALSDSRYLIVLCSANSRESPEVAREIEDFLSLPGHDCEDIVPVILEGHVGKDDDPLPAPLRDEAYTMRNLPTMVPEERESIKEAWENGLIGLVASMTRVERESINNRFLRDKRRRAIRLVQAGVAAIVVLAGLTGWAFYERQKAEEARSLAEEAQHHAEQEKNKAMALFEAGKEFSNEVIFDFNDQLSNLPQASSLQLRLIASTETYLNRLERQATFNPELQRLILAAKNQLGDISQIRGNTTEAKKLYEEALTIARQLNSFNPSNAQAQRDLSVSYNKLGDIFVAQGNLPQALDAFNRGLDLRKKIARDDPSNTQAQDDLRVSYAKLASVAEKQGDLKRALSYWEQALVISENSPDNLPTMPYTVTRRNDQPVSSVEEYRALQPADGADTVTILCYSPDGRRKTLHTTLPSTSVLTAFLPMKEEPI